MNHKLYLLSFILLNTAAHAGYDRTFGPYEFIVTSEDGVRFEEPVYYFDYGVSEFRLKAVLYPPFAIPGWWPSALESGYLAGRSGVATFPEQRLRNGSYKFKDPTLMLSYAGIARDFAFRGRNYRCLTLANERFDYEACNPCENERVSRCENGIPASLTCALTGRHAELMGKSDLEIAGCIRTLESFGEALGNPVWVRPSSSR
jgi:hypothetical protein